MPAAQASLLCAATGRNPTVAAVAFTACNLLHSRVHEVALPRAGLLWRQLRNSGIHRPQFAAANCAFNLTTFGGPQRAAFVTKVEPLYGLECQESVRILSVFFWLS